MPNSRKYWIEEVGPISLLPVLHERAEFARAVRDAVLELSPDYVAVELPAGLEGHYTSAVERLPFLSFITSGKLDDPASEGTSLWKVEPTDPFCEAVRSALELGIVVRFVDIHAPRYPSAWDRIPDRYSVHATGFEVFYKSCLEAISSSSKNLPAQELRESIDARRELTMAARLQRLSSRGRVLFVGGLKHIDPIKQALMSGEQLSADEEEFDAASCKLYHPSLRTVRTLSDEVPFLMTLYELQRGGPGPETAWVSPEGQEKKTPEKKTAQKQPKLTKESLFNSLSSLLGQHVEPEIRHLTTEQLKHLHSHLTSMRPETWQPPSFDTPGEASVSGTGANSEPDPQAEGIQRFFTYKNTEQRRNELLEEYGKANATCRTERGALDRQLVYRALLELAGRYYQDNTGEELKVWQKRNFNTFARRLAYLRGQLLPSLLNLMYAARACVDHNFAYEFWDLATFYPWQTEKNDYVEEFDFDGESLQIDGVRIKHFEFHRTFPRLRQSFSKMPIQDRLTPTGDPSDWSGAFESGRICSYPPEDIVIEDYGRYLQKKAIKVQSEAHSRTEPFTTSLLDGIDMRTTLRNWADGQKLYVKEEKKIQGGTGSVVIIFDEDKENTKFPWCITWHGEHDQESDMAFYGTNNRRMIIAPGIARCEYGGLMLSYPPRRLANVWNDPYYRSAKTKAEVLLFAAIDYCQDKHVVYVAEKAPRSYFFQLAQRLGKKLVYLPIGSLSPTSLERIRVFHVLAGHRYREMAKNFIW